MNNGVNAMVVRWKVAMMQFDFDVSGVKNVVVDLLNRLVKNPKVTQIVEETAKEVIDPRPNVVQTESCR